MKKRSQKLSLHRDTITRLDESLGREKLNQVAGGEYTSCMPDCPKEPVFGPAPLNF